MVAIVRTRNNEKVMTKAMQVQMIESALERKGIAADTVDVVSLIDETLHYYENLQAIGKFIGKELHADDRDTERQEAQYQDYEQDRMREIKQSVKAQNLPDRDGEIRAMYNMIKWKEALPLPSVALVTGRRGAGKSAMSYWLLEYLSKEYGVPAHVIGIPKGKYHLLPPSIIPLEMDDLDDLPENAIIFFDESALLFYSREWKEDSHALMDKLLSISRQKNQIIIMATHSSRKLDIALVADCDALLCKEQSMLTSRLDRKEIRQLSEQAMEEFKRIPEKERKKFTYVYCHTFEGSMLENPLPSFWSEELSRAFAGISITKGDSGGRRQTLEDAVEASEDRRTKILQLKQQCLTK